MNNGESKISRRLRIAALLCFVAALTFIVLLRVFSTAGFMQWYARYADTLINYENWVQQHGASWWMAGTILLNYVLKAVIPWLPLTIMLFVSGMIFDWYTAIALNAVGCIILFTIKFYYGKKHGGGNAEKILSRFDRAHIIVGNGKLGSKLALFIARATPAIPVNSVSQLYGTTTMPFWQYIIISVVGFSYKLFSYTLIGRNIFNPLSSAFIIPLTALLIFTGLILLLINAIITATSPLIKRIFKGEMTNHEQ